MRRGRGPVQFTVARPRRVRAEEYDLTSIRVIVPGACFPAKKLIDKSIDRSARDVLGRRRRARTRRNTGRCGAVAQIECK